MADGWSFACPDWEDRLRSGRTPIADLPLDRVDADVAVALFNKLRLPDIPGQPTLGEAGGEWTRDIVRAAFGSIDPETGERRVGEIFNLIPKKNSKTTNSAALGLVALQMNRRPNIDGVIVGPTQEVADKCFAQAVGMIEADGYLRKRFHVVEHKKTIIDLYRDPDTGVRMNARLKIKSFDLKVVTGSIPAFAIIDELHVMAQSASADRIIAQIRGGMITNPESLLIIITTQSDTPPAGVFKEELQYARGVRDGRITKSVRMLPVLYEFPEGMQTAEDAPWRDPKNWPLVLPNLGRSVEIDRLIDLHEAAREKGDAAERLWASQHLNVEIGLALHSDRWRGADYWLGAAEPGLTLEEIMDRSEVCTVGMDGGGLDDLFGLAVIGRCRETRRLLAWCHAWCQEKVLEERKEIAPALQDFERDGDLTICSSVGIDFDEAADIVADLHKAGLLPEVGAVGLDSAGAQGPLEGLDRHGLRPPHQVVPVFQGYKLNGVIIDVERNLKGGKLIHCGQPMMAWCVGNAKIELKGNAVLITKQAAGKAKIDPLAALLNAHQLMSRNPVAGVPLDVDAMVA